MSEKVILDIPRSKTKLHVGCTYNKEINQQELKEELALLLWKLGMFD